MAIDANILIFERIKDELWKQAKLKTAIQKWFESSWSAIWDSNLTWLIISIILYIFGINMIKWFGLMLGIWIVVSLFSAMYVSRLFIVILSRRKDISMKNFIGSKK
jgi:preprotein translocase subunit SecD